MSGAVRGDNRTAVCRSDRAHFQQMKLVCCW